MSGSATLGGVSVNGVRITADASGHTLQELSKLIALRADYCKESARHALGGIAITALQSIRSATRKRRRGRKVASNG